MRTYTKQYLVLDNVEIKHVKTQIERMLRYTYAITNKTEHLKHEERTEPQKEERHLYCNLRADLHTLKHQIEVDLKNSDSSKYTHFCLSDGWFMTLIEYWSNNSYKMSRDYPTIAKLLLTLTKGADERNR